MRLVSLFTSLASLTGLVVLQANPTFEAARVILEQNCLECHRDSKSKGGLKLDTQDNFLLGGDEQLAFNPKSPNTSELLRRVRLPHSDDEFMPPSSKKKKREALLTQEIAQLEKWLLAGAPWPSGTTLQEKEKTAPWENPDQVDPNLAKLEVFPAQVTLETASDYHRLVILAKSKDASTRDVSASAKLTILNPKLARREGTTLYPLSDGETKVRVDFRGQSKEISLTVKEAKKERPVSFQQDIVPIFTAGGCNTGSCHGSARGQDGFMLSLFGYDPEGDFQRVTREQLGRRINLAIPEESLLLTKASGQVPHTGGKLFEKDHPFYLTLLRWLQDGAKYDQPGIALPTKITVQPTETVLKGPNQRMQLAVRAEYSDGTDRDVSSLSSYTTSNDSVATINPKTGQALSTQRGESFLMARFHTFTQGSQTIVIPEHSNYQKPTLAAHNYIDEHVHAKLHKLRIIPSPLASDEVFVRRIYLDLIGLLPTPEERAQFLTDTQPNKRARLIDSLLERKEFTEIWVMKWAELLQIRSNGNNGNQVTPKAANLWYEWLYDQVSSGTSFDQIVRNQLTTSGGTLTEPQTNYFKLEKDVKKISENVAQVFLGTRIQCAQCHNHPFDRWTMDDYYGCLLYTSPSPRDQRGSRMPSSA